MHNSAQSCTTGPIAVTACRMGRSCAGQTDRPRVYWSFVRKEERVKKRTSDREAANRRAFLKLGGAAAAGLMGGAAAGQTPSAPPAPHATDAQAMPVRNLGRTGYKVGIFSLGGQAALERAHNEAVAVPIVERALDLGVNYIDTSSIYGGPERWSERYIGQVMKRRRAQAFLASKTKERTRDGSLRMLEQSLKLLQTDHLDLWQLHDIGLADDVDAVFAKDPNG